MSHTEAVVSLALGAAVVLWGLAYLYAESGRTGLLVNLATTYVMLGFIVGTLLMLAAIGWGLGGSGR